jgi:hypothetical protein
MHSAFVGYGGHRGSAADADSFAAMRSATMIVVTFVATDGARFLACGSCVYRKPHPY